KNGYRIYDYQQIEELKRIAELVRSGHTISSLIREGQPVIPRQNAPATSPYARLDQIALPVQPGARSTFKQMVRALRHQQYGAAHGILERANWELHPQQLVHTCYVPVLIALAEIKRLPATSPAQDPVGQELLLETIGNRCDELMHRFPASSDAIAVVPMEEEVQTLAKVIALALCLDGRSASVLPCREQARKRQPVITVSDHTCPLDVSDRLGHCSALENDRDWTITQIPHCVPATSRRRSGAASTN
ncbi:MAG: hypothetical protein ACOCXJ_05410, partial [Planctomycetota bacterium]